MRLHFEAVLQQGLQHRTEIINGCLCAVCPRQLSRVLSDDVNLRRIEPLRCSRNVFLIEIPGNRYDEPQRKAWQVHAPTRHNSEKTWRCQNCAGHSWFDVCYFELSR